MKRNRIPALLLAMLLALSLSVSAFAAGSTTATVPVTLTVDNQYRAVNVTVPSSLPVYVTAVGRIIPPPSTGVPNAAQAAHTAAMTMPIMLTATATACVMAAGVK